NTRCPTSHVPKANCSTVSKILTQRGALDRTRNRYHQCSENVSYFRFRARATPSTTRKNTIQTTHATVNADERNSPSLSTPPPFTNKTRHHTAGIRPEYDVTLDVQRTPCSSRATLPPHRRRT